MSAPVVEYARPAGIPSGLHQMQLQRHPSAMNSGQPMQPLRPSNSAIPANAHHTNPQRSFSQPIKQHLRTPQQLSKQPRHAPSQKLAHFLNPNSPHNSQTAHLPLARKPPQRQPSTISTLPTSSSMTSVIPSATMYPPNNINNSRRTPSNSSQTSSPQTSVRRTSSTSSSASSSYVALLRKQKATVWCDRSQAEDPRIIAAQRLAKERAEREVALLPGQHGSTTTMASRRTPPNSNPSSFTSGVARKIRHHGAQKATTYAGGNMAGAGVPMRLSASEVDDDEEDGAGERLESMRLDDTDWDAQFYGAGKSMLSGPNHHRSASGHSRPTLGLHEDRTLGLHEDRTLGLHEDRTLGLHEDRTLGLHEDSTPTEEHPGIPEIEKRAGNYFHEKKGNGDTSSPEDEEEREKREDELRRRGSVDDRAMTMSGVRLFIANPDSD